MTQSRVAINTLLARVSTALATNADTGTLRHYAALLASLNANRVEITPPTPDGCTTRGVPAPSMD